MSNSYGGAGTARSEKVALTNVRVFDGHELRGPTTVVIEGGFVGRDSAGARITDAGGATLLPGLIDAHVHLLNEEHLQQLADFGITTALDMGAWPPSMVDSLRRSTGMADIRSAGIPATVAGSTHSHLPGYPAEEMVDGPTGAARVDDPRTRRVVAHDAALDDHSGRPVKFASIEHAHVGQRDLFAASRPGAVEQIRHLSSFNRWCTLLRRVVCVDDQSPRPWRRIPRRKAVQASKRRARQGSLPRHVRHDRTLALGADSKRAVTD